MDPAGTKRVINFFSEAGMLKRVTRSGWWVLGVKDPETVAEHSFRCAVIGYALAKLEKVDPYRVLLMTLLNDLHEARTGDLHKMSQRYFDFEKAEDGAFSEQIAGLPSVFQKELAGIRREYRTQRSRESLIARDADILECLIQAKEYYEHGFREAVKFMKKAPSFLKTASARSLWWEVLSEFKR
jgi:putative hydrolase of HD superfamily